MEDQVPFKVFTYWTENAKPEVRRFGIEKTLVTSYIYLNAKLQEIFPGLKGRSYSVAWRDEEGDDVTVSSDEEVMTALTSMPGDLIKLHVYVKDGEAKNDDCDIIITASVTDNGAGVSGATGNAPPVHYGVMCDACDSSISGFRYKCTICDDYDLCSKCEASGLHPEHCMVRVPTPIMPRTVIKAAIKRSRQFLKTVSGTVGDECPYKKHSRREKSAERKHREREGGHGDHFRGERHHRRPRSSWLDTFATYMNEFANLAGDIDLDAERKAGSQPAQPTQDSQGAGQPPQPGTQEPAQERPKTSTDTAGAPKPSTSGSDIPQCPFTPALQNLQSIEKLINMYVGGKLNLHDFIPKPPASESSDASVNTSVPTNNASVNTTNVSTNNASVNTGDLEMGQMGQVGQTEQMGQVGQEQSETDTSVQSDSSASSASKRDESPDKADDWTVINKEKDLMDAYMKASAPNEPATPIGFNLPQEFQDRMRIGEGQNLYPALNTATAVLDPKEPERPATVPAPQPTQAPPKPQPSQAQPKPAPPRQRHPKAHIDAAIQQMLAMGFTNEGGWLTQLLENKDGNIAAVLDLLTPVKK